MRTKPADWVQMQRGGAPFGYLRGTACAFPLAELRRSAVPSRPGRCPCPRQNPGPRRRTIPPCRRTPAGPTISTATPSPQPHHPVLRPAPDECYRATRARPGVPPPKSSARCRTTSRSCCGWPRCRSGQWPRASPGWAYRIVISAMLTGALPAARSRPGLPGRLARPARRTRSTPPRDDAWYARKSVFPSRPDQ